MQLNVSHTDQDLKLWEKIEIIVGQGSDAGRYLARIEDFANEGIVISNPEFKGGQVLLRQNSDVTIQMKREDAVYEFSSRIKQVTVRGRRIHLLSSLRHPKRVQRREFVRVELYTKVSYTNLTANTRETNSQGQITWRETTALNISGGGMLIRTSGEITEDDLLLLNVGFFKEIGLPATVAGICRRIFRQNNDHYAGIEFLRWEQLRRHMTDEATSKLPQSVREFDQTAQNKLVAHVFHEQIELRRKGLL